MKANLKIDQNDLKVLFSHVRGVYGKMSFETWCEECEKSYMSYFNNKDMFMNNRYTYSEFVNAQVIALY